MHNHKNANSSISAEFRAWERRARGWETWDLAVDLEPPFVPVEFTPRAPVIIHDDARIGALRNPPLIIGPANANGAQRSVPLRQPKSFYRTQPIRELQLIPTADLEVPTANAVQFLLNLSSRTPIAFELLADVSRVTAQFACDESFAPSLKDQIIAFCSDVALIEARNQLDAFLPESAPTVIADIGLGNSFLRPLASFKNFSPDPLTGLVTSMCGLEENESAVMQVLFHAVRGAWAGEIERVRNARDLRDAIPESDSAIKEKLSSPLFAVVLRIAVRSGSFDQAWRRLRSIGSNLLPFSGASGNEFIALSGERITRDNHIFSLKSRTSYRSGMLLNAAELSGLVHVPSGNIRADKLSRSNGSTKPVPDIALNGSLVLGANIHNGVTKSAKLTSEQRSRHMHLVGATGSGKSTLLTSLMTQDLEQGNGFALFDPHGDVVDSIIERIPNHLLKDVILFNPADEDFPIGFNILSANSELERTLLSSDLVGIFRRFATSWGDQMNSVLSNAVVAFLESSRGGSLIDLKRFLVDKSFRREFLTTVDDDEIRFYWEREFPELRGKPYAPLLTRLDTFLRSKLIRHIVAQRENKLDFRAIMDEGKILLVKLSLGAIGEENAYLLGSLLVAKIYMAALSRQEIAETQRKPFYLYLDEAHHFLTPSMNQILSGVRKYKVGLTLAHQQLAQFQKADADILASVLSNCYTRICFRVDDSDAERLAKGLSFFTSDNLRNLGVGEAIARIEQSQFSFNLKTFPVERVPESLATERRNVVTETSRALYGKPRVEVKAELRREQPAEPPIPEVSQPGPAAYPQPEVEDHAATEIGRGGRHHQELQRVIRRMAEKLGFSAEIEKPILGSRERVDVSLEKDQLRVACEVSVTTTDYEVRNAEKCLAEEYDHIVIVVANQKKIPLITRKLEEEIPVRLLHKVKVCGLMDLLAFLNQLAVGHDNSSERSKTSAQRLDLREASELLGKSQATVYRWLREGRIPFYRVGREYEFDRDELLLIGRQDLSAKRKATVKLSPLTIEKSAPKTKKEQDARYRKLLKLDKIEEPLHTRREKEANDS